MDFFDKIKTWFKKLTTRTPAKQEVKEDRSAQSEINQLIDEHTTLNGEHEQIRKELADIDDKLRLGEIEVAEHDREYRVKLIRTSQIQLRQMEIRARLSDLDSPLPE